MQSFQTYIESFIKEKKEKNFILEPLTVIFRLSMLQYKDKGTKISIRDNSIHYQPPSYGQGIIRMIDGDTREDLHNLYHPILKCVEWYPYESYQFIYNECIKGIDILNSNYEIHSTIKHTLNHYIDVIRSKDTTNISRCVEINPVIDSLKEIWVHSEIQSAISLLRLIHEDINRDIYLDSLELIIHNKEKFINEYLHRISTEY